MPRYYKDKIYEESTRIIFGKLGFETMQEKKNKLLANSNLTLSEYELILDKAADAAYRKQIKKSAERQKTF